MLKPSSSATVHCPFGTVNVAEVESCTATLCGSVTVCRCNGWPGHCSTSCLTAAVTPVLIGPFGFRYCRRRRTCPALAEVNCQRCAPFSTCCGPTQTIGLCSDSNAPSRRVRLRQCCSPSSLICTWPLLATTALPSFHRTCPACTGTFQPVPLRRPAVPPVLRAHARWHPQSWQRSLLLPGQSPAAPWWSCRAWWSCPPPASHRPRSADAPAHSACQ